MQELDQRDLRTERLDAFHVEAHGEPPAGARSAQVRDRLAEQVTVRVRLDEMADARRRPDHALERHEAVADVHRHDVDAHRAVARELRQELVDVPERQAGVIVPDEPGLGHNAGILGEAKRGRR